MDPSRQPDPSRPVFRIVRDDSPAAKDPSLASVGDGISFSTAEELVSELKLARAGAEIVKSLVESETRSSITLPKGTTDREGLLALNALSEQTRGRYLFSEPSLFALEYWATENRAPCTHRRTYPVELFVQATADHDAWEANRALSQVRIEAGMRLAPADPVEAALVLGAHVLSRRGETPAQHLFLRTASTQITLTYFRLRQEIMLTDRDPETRHESVLTAASPVPREPRWGLLGTIRRLIGSGYAAS